jgi:hypothetical protein
MSHITRGPEKAVCSKLNKKRKISSEYVLGPVGNCVVLAGKEEEIRLLYLLPAPPPTIIP